MEILRRENYWKHLEGDKWFTKDDILHRFKNVWDEADKKAFNFLFKDKDPIQCDESLIQDSWPELHQAIVRKEFEFAETILESDPSQMDQFGLSPLNDREVKMLSALFKEGHPTDYSALELAILSHAPIHFIEHLIELGADINANRAIVLSTDRIEIRTPLYASY